MLEVHKNSQNNAGQNYTAINHVDGKKKEILNATKIATPTHHCKILQYYVLSIETIFPYAPQNAYCYTFCRLITS